jgi:hypothetical protein
MEIYFLALFLGIRSLEIYKSIDLTSLEILENFKTNYFYLEYLNQLTTDLSEDKDFGNNSFVEIKLNKQLIDENFNTDTVKIFF